MDKIIEFEKEARLTESGVLYWSINDREYKNKLTQTNLESLENSKIVIAKQRYKAIERGIGKILLEESENYFKSRFVSYYFLMTAFNEQAREFYHRQDSLKFSKREVAEKDL